MKNGKEKYVNESSDNSIDKNTAANENNDSVSKEKNKGGESGTDEGNVSDSQHRDASKGARKNNPQETDGDAEKEKEVKENEEIEKRGRHKKECDCEKCVAKRSAKEEPPKVDEIGKSKIDLSLYKRVEQSKNPTAKILSEKVDLTQFISGALFLICMDAVLPSMILMIFGWFNKKYKGVDSKKLRLDADEQKRLEPLAEQIVKLIFGSCNPIVAFAVTYGMIIAGKIMTLEDEDFKPLPIKKKEDK